MIGLPRDWPSSRPSSPTLPQQQLPLPSLESQPQPPSLPPPSLPPTPASPRERLPSPSERPGAKVTCPFCNMPLTRLPAHVRVKHLGTKCRWPGCVSEEHRKFLQGRRNCYEYVTDWLKAHNLEEAYKQCGNGEEAKATAKTRCFWPECKSPEVGGGVGGKSALTLFSLLFLLIWST